MPMLFVNIERFYCFFFVRMRVAQLSLAAMVEERRDTCVTDVRNGDQKLKSFLSRTDEKINVSGIKNK